MNSRPRDGTSRGECDATRGETNEEAEQPRSGSGRCPRRCGLATGALQRGALGFKVRLRPVRSCLAEIVGHRGGEGGQRTDKSPAREAAGAIVLGGCSRLAVGQVDVNRHLPVHRADHREGLRDGTRFRGDQGRADHLYDHECGRQQGKQDSYVPRASHDDFSATNSTSTIVHLSHEHRHSPGTRGLLLRSRNGLPPRLASATFAPGGDSLSLPR